MIKDYIKYIPLFFTRDSKLTAFADAHDTQIKGALEEIKNFSSIYDPVRTPFISELGEYLDADLLNSDSDREKRVKVSKAVSNHKTRSLWKTHVKNIIDAIAGGDSSLEKYSSSADWVLLGHEKNDPDNYFSTMGTEVADTSAYVFESETDFILVESSDESSNGTLGSDGENDYGADLMGSQVGSEGDTYLGIDLIGKGDELEIPGNIYIDVDNKILTDSQLLQIEESLEDVLPAYFIIYLGYKNNSGQFITYSNGIIK